MAWTSVDPKVVSPDVPTPAFAYGDFFVLNKDRRVMARVNPTDGEIKWHTRVPGSDDYESSPLVCDGKIYIVSHTGRVVVIDAENGEQLFQMQMDKARPDKTRASIVAAQGQLFIRTTNKLYCIAKQ